MAMSVFIGPSSESLRHPPREIATSYTTYSRSSHKAGNRTSMKHLRSECCSVRLSLEVFRTGHKNGLAGRGKESLEEPIGFSWRGGPAVGTSSGTTGSSSSSSLLSGQSGSVPPRFCACARIAFRWRRGGSRVTSSKYSAPTSVPSQSGKPSRKERSAWGTSLTPRGFSPKKGGERDVRSGGTSWRCSETSEDQLKGVQERAIDDIPRECFPRPQPLLPPDRSGPAATASSQAPETLQPRGRT